MEDKKDKRVGEMFYGESISDMSGLSHLACDAALYIDCLVIGQKVDEFFSRPIEILASRIKDFVHPKMTFMTLGLY